MSESKIDPVYEVEPITVVFVGDLNTVRFMQGDHVVDARDVLVGLAFGTITVEYEKELAEYDSTSLSAMYVKSETWRIVPKVGK